MILKCYTDGGGNNHTKSNMYGSYLILNNKEVLCYKTFKLKMCTTSNEAEYMTFILLLDELLENYKNNKIFVYSDSKLVVNQTKHNKKKWRVFAENLKPYNKKAIELLEKFEDIQVLWTPREQIVEKLGH
jgi:ribonuclease HI